MPQVVEIWAPGEFADLADWERPFNKVWRLPGIGYATLREPEGDSEIDDILDIEDQQAATAELEREMS